MSKEANPKIIGLFVVGAVFLAVAAVLIFGSGRLFRDSTTFVAYFSGSVSGLTVGSPVEFRGVKVGTVSDIKLSFDRANVSVAIPVYISFEKDRLSVIEKPGASSQDVQEMLKLLIDKGFRARLKQQSFVTGQLAIELNFFPGTPLKLSHVQGKYMEIPTIPSTTEEVSRAVANTLSELNKVPFKEIMNDLRSALQGIDRIVNSPETAATFKELNQTLKDSQQLVHNIDSHLAPVLKTMDGTLKDTRKLIVHMDERIVPLTATVEATARDVGTLVKNTDARMGPLLVSLEKTSDTVRSALDEGSTVRYELTRTLEEMSGAARSLRILADYLERYPESLLYGKGKK